MKRPAHAALAALIVSFLSPALASGRREVRDGPGEEVGRFEQDVARRFTTADGLPSDDVRAVAVTDDGAVWAGTAAGLARRAPDAARFEAVAEVGSQAVTALTADGRRMWALTAGTARAVGVNTEGEPRWRWPAPADARVVVPWARVPLPREARGVVRHENMSMIPVVVEGPPLDVHAIAVARAGAAFAARQGLFVTDGGALDRLVPDDGRRRWNLVDVTGVAYDGRGRLWFTWRRGAGLRDGDAWRLLTGHDGLPREDATTITAVPGDPQGRVWIGTPRGAIRTDGATFEYRQGPRWLPHDEVRAIAADSQGNAWFATPAGLGLIERRPMTLADKAVHFGAEIDARHRRTPLGYVDGVHLDRPGDLASFRQRDSDNDGLWTSMYGAAECFAYAATKDPAARERARAAFRALRFLSEVTQGGSHPAPPGFVARSILPTSGPNPNERHGRARDEAFRRTRDGLWKVMDLRWPTSADGQWFWKCDTSSDELDGHFFFYAQYHDLVCETPEERAEVAAVVGAILGHLEAHGWRLVDWDGRPTRWANYSPASLNHDPDWIDERGLNSLSLLSYLAVGAHVTGDARWRRHARALVAEHGYAMNVLQGTKPHRGVGTGNQSDDEMAFMSFYDLLLYEDDPALRAIYARAFAQAWALEAPERSPLFAFLYAGVNTGATARTPWGEVDLSPRGGWLTDAVDALRRFPLDRVDWPHRNADRADVVRFASDDPAAPPRGALRDGRALPVDERSFGHWNHDPWRLDSGGDGRSAADGAAYLLPWALGRYHGFVRE